MNVPLKNRIQVIKRKIITDTRGYFLKVLTGEENGLPDYTGEIYLTVANPGSSKGGHYHIMSTEWFTIIKGDAILELTDIRTNETIELELYEKDPQTIVVPPYVAHRFYSYGSGGFTLLAYCDRLYDPKDTIIFGSITKI